MFKHITKHTFYKYLKCPHWLLYELENGEDTREPLLAKLQDEGLLSGIEEDLLKDKQVVSVDCDDVDEAAQKTAEFMKGGAPTIYKGALVHGNWVGRPDILERVEGKSSFGDWYYVACDMKRSKYLKDEYKIQGAFYAEILEHLQGVRPIQGYVMHIDGGVEGYLIDEVYANFRLMLDEIERISEGKQPTHFLTAACKQSPWFWQCEQKTRECDDLSLINRLWTSEAEAIKEAGFTSLSALADAKTQDLKRVSGITKDRIQFLQLQAMSLKEGRIIKLAPVKMPQNDKPALVVDVESDPLRDVDYLIGVLKIEDTKKDYFDFLAKDPSQEKRVWEEFLHFLQAYQDSYLYHYGWYERDVFTKLTQKYGAPDWATGFFETRMVDVLTSLREAVIFPIPFYSLKDIAKFLGFKWRISDASGLDSVIWYHAWLNTKNKQTLRDIVEYNEDDVRATWHLIEWANGSR